MKSLLQFARDVADSVMIWCLVPRCPVCGTNLQAHIDEVPRPCPFAPHEEPDGVK